MPVLKIYKAHVGRIKNPTAKLQSYLECPPDPTTKVLAKDFSFIGGKKEEDIWGSLMDKTRRLMGNDSSYSRNKKGVLYWHFAIYFDPADASNLVAVRKATMAWANLWFGDFSVSGLLGEYETAAIYHSLKDGEFISAHVVVNNTNVSSGRRLRVSKKVFGYDFFCTLQKAAYKYKLNYLTERWGKEIDFDRVPDTPEPLLFLY